MNLRRSANSLLPFALTAIISLCTYSLRAEDELSGKWVGTWTDKRPASGNSGGPLWAEAKHEQGDTWKLTFRIDSKRKYEVVFKGKREHGELTFNGFTDAHDARGLYYWTAKISEKGFTGTYEGVEEKGIFTLAREVETPPIKQ